MADGIRSLFAPAHPGQLQALAHDCVLHSLFTAPLPMHQPWLRYYERLSETLAGLQYVAYSSLMLHKAAPLFAGGS